MSGDWAVHNAGGSRRVVVTKQLPGTRWLEVLTTADCSIEVCTSEQVLDRAGLEHAIGDHCDGVIGQLTEDWDEALFGVLAGAGGRVYSNYAVGYDNVDVDGATRHGIPVGNTPGVLTETTAEMAVALTCAAARRVVEASRFMRAGKYEGWLPTMFLGKRFVGSTVGVVGCGRIGAAYARMMVEGFKMHVVYFDVFPNEELERYVADYSDFVVARGGDPVTCRRLPTVEQVLAEADVVSLHTVLDETTHHLIDAARLALMKENAVLVNTSRGPVVDEEALVAHCRANPDFRAGLDVVEDEPAMKPGLAELENVVVVPHIASATVWTRRGMATLAAANVAGILQGHPLWAGDDVGPLLEGPLPAVTPSIVNAARLGLT